MGSTNQQIVNDAFQMLGITTEGRTPSPSQSATGVRTLSNNLLTQMSTGWKDLGWYPQTSANLTQLAPLRDADIEDVTLCLAGWLAPKFGVVIEASPDEEDMTKLVNQIKAAFKRMNKKYLRLTECDLGELSRAQGGPWGGPNWL